MELANPQPEGLAPLPNYQLKESCKFSSGLMNHKILIAFIQDTQTDFSSIHLQVFEPIVSLLWSLKAGCKILYIHIDHWIKEILRLYQAKN